MNDVTRILESIEQGEPEAAAALLPLVYDELRRIAAHKMAQLSPGQTLQPTALVHEAWLRLAKDPNGQWNGQKHFLNAAAEAMRCILVDQARRKRADKRGGGEKSEELNESEIASAAPTDEMLAVHEALDRLARHDLQAAELVKLRYFVGLTLEEIAAALGISPRTAGNMWNYGRAWLGREIRGYQ